MAHPKKKHKYTKITKVQYEFALARIEELLPMADDNTPANDRNAVELTMISDVVKVYEKELLCWDFNRNSILQEKLELSQDVEE